MKEALARIKPPGPASELCDHSRPIPTPVCAGWAVELAALFAIAVAAGCASVPTAGFAADGAAPPAADFVGCSAWLPFDPLYPVAVVVSGALCSAGRPVFAAAADIGGPPSHSPN